LVGDITFGGWPKRRRRQLDLTQKGLVFQADCSVGTIRKIEADERRPSRQLATLLAQHLDIPLEHREPFITFARAEPYTADIYFPTPDPAVVPTVAIPAIP
jgi:transcriptional regulator with XRE-family HTH domain